MRPSTRNLEIIPETSWESELIEFICEALTASTVEYDYTTLEFLLRTRPWPIPEAQISLTVIHSSQGSVFSILGYPGQTRDSKKCVENFAIGPLGDLPRCARQFVVLVRAVLRSRGKLTMKGQLITARSRQAFEFVVLPHRLRLSYLGPVRGQELWG